MRDGGKYDSYTKEDFEEIWENDPQYVNEKVYRPLPGTSPESIERQNTIQRKSLATTVGI